MVATPGNAEKHQPTDQSTESSGPTQEAGNRDQEAGAEPPKESPHAQEAEKQFKEAQKEFNQENEKAFEEFSINDVEVRTGLLLRPLEKIYKRVLGEEKGKEVINKFNWMALCIGNFLGSTALDLASDAIKAPIKLATAGLTGFPVETLFDSMIGNVYDVQTRNNYIDKDIDFRFTTPFSRIAAAIPAMFLEHIPGGTLVDALIGPTQIAAVMRALELLPLVGGFVADAHKYLNVKAVEIMGGLDIDPELAKLLAVDKLPPDYGYIQAIGDPIIAGAKLLLNIFKKKI